MGDSMVTVYFQIKGIKIQDGKVVANAHFQQQNVGYSLSGEVTVLCESNVTMEDLRGKIVEAYKGYLKRCSERDVEFI